MSHLRLRSAVMSAVVLVLAPPAHADSVWKGTTTAWNTTTNWTPTGVPTAITIVDFTNTGVGNVVISAAASANTLNFSNTTGSYNLTSSTGITLGSLQGITVGSADTTTDTINLANVATGSMIFTNPFPNFANNSTAAGTTLVIGPNTVIGDSSVEPTIFVVGSGNTQVTGSFASGADQVTGGLTKGGTGTLTLSGNGSNLAGGLALTGGTLVLDYSSNTATKLNASGSLSLLGGVLSLTTNTSTAVTQTVASTVLTSGHTDVTATGTGTVTLAAGNIIRSAGVGTVDFNLAGPANFTVQATGATGDAGVLQYATVNGGSTWAVLSGSAAPYTIAPFTAYSTDAYSTNYANVDVVSPPATPPSNILINTLRFNSGNQTLTLSGSNHLALGGILVTPNATGGTINPSSSSDQLSSAQGEIIVHQYSSAPFAINISIQTDFLTKTGPGTLVLGGVNSFLGINVYRGSLTATTPAAVNSTTNSINFTDDRSGAALQTFTVNLGNGVNGTVTPAISVAAFSPTSYGTAFSTGTSTNSRITLSGSISSVAPVNGVQQATPIGFTGPAADTSGFNLTGTNTFTGTVYLAHGYLGVTSDANLGDPSNGLVLGTGDTQNGGLEFLNSFLTSRPITVAASTRIVVDPITTAFLLGTLTSSGTGSGFQLVKSGTGTLEIEGTSTGFTGGVTLSGGQLLLASTLGAGGALTLNGGVLQLSSVGQTFSGGTAVNAGHTDVNNPGGVVVALSAGAVTHTAGGTVDFNLTGTSIGGAALNVTTSTGATNGLLGSGPAFATVNNGATWATSTSGTVVGLATYGTAYTSGVNVDMTTSSSQSGVTVNSLRFNNGNQTLTLSGTNTLQSGGVLTTANTFGGSAISGGTLTASGSGELLFHVYGPALTVNSALVSAVGLTKTGQGSLALGGNNTGLTGPININRGMISVTTVAAVNSASAINFNGLSAQSFSFDLGSGGSGTITPPILLSAFGPPPNYGTILANDFSQTVTLAGAISSAPGLTTSVRFTGNFNLTGANTFTGPVDLQHGSLGINSGASLGNAINTLLLEVNDTTAGGLVFLNGGVTVNQAIAVTAPTRIVVNGTDSNTIAGVISGTAGIFKDGTGTLTLTNANTVTGGVTVNAGTLALTNANALPAGTNVTVAAAAVFNPISGTSTNFGTVTLNGGTLRTGALITVNQLVSNSDGVLDMSSNFNQSFQITNSIAVNANATWLSGNSSFINNAGTQFVPITISTGVTLNNAIGLSGAGFTVTGGGTLNQTSSLVNANDVTASLTVSGGTTYRVTDVNNGVAGNLGAGVFTLDGGTLDYAGTTAGTSKVIALTGSGGTIAVESPAAMLTLLQGVSGPGPLTKIGPGTLYLDGAIASFTSLTINGGTLQTSADANLGSGPVTVNAAGTLLYFSNTSTSRTINLNSGTLANSATVTLNNANVYGGFLHGPGTFVVTNNTTLSGVSSSNNAVINVTGAGMFTNFSNSGSLTISAGSGMVGTFSTFINQGSGSITVAATSLLNVSDFQTYGTLTINPATITENFSQTTLITNAGTSQLSFNGGSRTFVGTPQTAVFPPSSPQHGQPTFVAGIDLNGQNATVAGGLFVNNGYVEDSTNNFQGSATIIADFGALVKGSGFFQNSVVTQNGGKFQAGNSPGAATFGKFALGPGGVNNYVFAIDDATGAAGPSPDAAGHVSGWGLVKVGAPPVNDRGLNEGDFTWTATPADKLTVALQTLVNPTTVGIDVPGTMDHFDPDQPYSWPAVEWSGNYAGPADAATLDASTTFDVSGFANPVAGSFGWDIDAADHMLSLVYTPSAVPEPGSLTLAALGAVGLMVRRLRHGRVTSTSVNL